MKKITIQALFFCSLFLSLNLNAQEIKDKNDNADKVVEGVVGPDGYVRCLSVEMNEKLRENGLKESKQEFEDWLAPKIAEYKANRMADGETIITIPVVIHIIHNGDAINTNGAPANENISYAQAISQIDVLNEDYRRIAGTPGGGTSGYGLGVDVRIEFCLAQQDPDGIETDGVNRVNMGQASWSEYDIETVVKPSTIWDPTQYMNMWSIKFSNSTLLGYAQFPSSSGLPGLNTNGGAANTDGVVSNYNVFGTVAQDDNSFVLNPTYNLGRTMTHEVGHWLGLIHIWGDSSSCLDGATNGDFVVDTPASSQPNYSCAPVNHCGTADMIENYMDYTNDACMNTFTEGQKTRILTVMANSPRRMELGSSTVCQPLVIFDLDGAINIIDVATEPCSTTISPQVEILNMGNNSMTSATVTYYIQGQTPQSVDWTGSLAFNESDILDLPQITAPIGEFVYMVEISNINGGTDEQMTDNEASRMMKMGAIGNFDTTLFNLTIVPDNYGSETTWTVTDNDGNVEYQGGPYTDDNTTPINVSLELDGGTCHIFTIYDAYQDGMCCEFGTGSFQLKTDDNTVIYSGGTFGISDSVSFSRTQTASVSDNEYANSISIYPNPARGVLNIATSNNELPSNIKIYNMMGQLIAEKNIDSASDLNMNVSAFSSGIYFIKIQKDNKAAVLQFIKE